jgi:hypothetical protein
MKMRTSIAVCALAAVFFAATAEADVSPEIHVAAEALFREGSELFARGDVALAFARFEASNRLEPAPGKRFNMATCHARLHHAASAWVLFRDVARDYERVGDGERAALARAKAAEVEPTLAYLKVTVARPVADLKIVRAGAELPREAWGVDVPVDTGSYEVHASAAGHVGWKGLVDVSNDGDHAEIQIPFLAEQPAPPPPKHGTSLLRPLGWIGVGLGVAGVAVGSIEGLEASSHWNSAQKGGCSSTGVCTSSTAFGDLTSAQTAATVSDVAFIAGGVFVAAGVVALVVPRKEKGPALGMTLRVGPSGLSVAGEL